MEPVELRARRRMRRPVDADRVRAFMRALGLAVRGEHTVYLVGGATAVLEGWRESTVDIDVALGDAASADELLSSPAARWTGVSLAP